MQFAIAGAGCKVSVREKAGLFDGPVVHRN